MKGVRLPRKDAIFALCTVICIEKSTADEHAYVFIVLIAVHNKRTFSTVLWIGCSKSVVRLMYWNLAVCIFMNKAKKRYFLDAVECEKYTKFSNRGSECRSFSSSIVKRSCTHFLVQTLTVSKLLKYILTKS